MLTIEKNSVANAASQATVTRRPRNIALLADGCFLLAVGLIFGISEFVSHFWGIGLQGVLFLGSPYTIGFFEAHGLAALVGFLLIRATRGSEQRFWHGFAALVHLLLGGSNLTYWVSFVTFDFVVQGVIVTLAHGLFIVLQLVCYVQTRSAANP